MKESESLFISPDDVINSENSLYDGFRERVDERAIADGEHLRHLEMCEARAERDNGVVYRYIKRLPTI